MHKKNLFRLLKVFIATGIILILVLMAFLIFSPQFGASPSGNHLESIEKSSNYSEGQFVNLIPTQMDINFSSGMGIMYEWFFTAASREPAKPLPVMFGKNGKNESENRHANITWFGHSAILLELDGKKIFLDPMLGNASSPVPFLSKRFKYEKQIDIQSIPDLDAVILSHDHYDHLDYGSIVQLKDKVAHFFTPLGVGSHLKRWGVDASKITELDWWESSKIEGIQVISAPARHFSGRGINDRNKTQWASWIILGANERIYFSGDGGYGPHFKEIGQKYGPFDFAMMECGQYNELWEAIHMMPEQTIEASLDIQAKKMMPIHWSAFNLSLHSWTEPVIRAAKAADELGATMITPLIGERFSPAMSVGGNYWWNEFLPN